MLHDGDEFLGFLESIDLDLTRETVEGPDDKPLPAAGAIESAFVRLRLGALLRSDFREMMPRVDPLASPSRDVGARARRLSQLREVLRPERLPLVDIHLPRWASLFDEVMETARLGAWLQFRIERYRRGRLLAPVFFSYPADDTVLQAFLTSFDLPAEDEADRLRDIFSLAHVGEWGTDDGAGGEPIIPPPQPLDGYDLQLVTLPCNPKPSVVEAEQEVYLAEADATSTLHYVRIGQ